MTIYTEEDAETALPNHFPISGTDIEMSVGLSGHDLTLWVNKSGVQILRIRLKDAGKLMTSDQLFAFSPVSPDFAFKIGDTAEGIERLKRSLGLVL